MKLRLLVLTNEANPGDSAGQVDGFTDLVRTGEIESCHSVSFIAGYDEIEPKSRILNAIRSIGFDVLIIFSPSSFPNNESEFSEILNEISGRPILYWEGDPWDFPGSKKGVTPQMAWWMKNSEIVFSVAGEPHLTIFKSAGANVVKRTIHTYCHLKFERQEFSPPLNNISELRNDALMIANNLSRIPGITGVHGSLSRWELAARINFSSDFSSKIYGQNWPKNWSSGPLKYSAQGDEIRASKINLNWDHFPNHEGYVSDRFAVALISGRPHVTSAHSNMGWAPGGDEGLFFETTPRKIIQRTRQLLNMDPLRLGSLGINGHRWAKRRVSHREAARHILSSYYPELSRPPADPWDCL
jgi:hypothetical protein